MAKPTPPPHVPNQPPKLLDRLRIAIRLKNYSIRTEQAYVAWVERYIRFHKLRHPQELGAPEIEAFLAHLAVAGNVAASALGRCRPPRMLMQSSRTVSILLKVLKEEKLSYWTSPSAC